MMVRWRERCGKCVDGRMAEKMRKICGESMDGGKDAENIRRICGWRERCGDVENA